MRQCYIFLKRRKSIILPLIFLTTFFPPFCCFEISYSTISFLFWALPETSLWVKPPDNKFSEFIHVWMSLFFHHFNRIYSSEYKSLDGRSFLLNGEKCYVIPMEKCHGTSSRKEAHHLLMTPVVLMRNILPFQLLFFLVSNLLVFYKRVFSVFVLSNTCLYISWDRYLLTFFFFIHSNFPNL